MANILQDIQKLAIKKRPDIQPGNTVKIHQRIKEGEKERVQMFEGLVLKTNSGFGADKTITVRKIVDGIGVERTFPLYSTNIQKIEVKKKGKVRRAKLYYMRGRSGKSARMKETFVSEKELEESIEELADQKAEEDKKEKTAEAQADGVVTEAEKQEIEGEKEAGAPKEEAKEESKEEEPAKEPEAKEEPKEEPKEESKEEPKEEA